MDSVTSFMEQGLGVPEALIIGPSTYDEKTEEMSVQLGWKVGDELALTVGLQSKKGSGTVKEAVVTILNEVRKEAGPEDDTPYAITGQELLGVILKSIGLGK